MKKNLKGLSISSHNDELSNTTVQSLGGLVSSPLQLLVVGGLLNNIKNLEGEFGGGKGEGLGVDVVLVGGGSW